jgi:uncharacterized tellurite resistance protein B-like protein
MTHQPTPTHLTQTTMEYKEVLTKLYFILVCADGNVNEKEVSYGRKMVEAEGIDESFFLSQIKLLEASAQQAKLPEAIANLKTLKREEQIRAIAWLCIIANSDGFMDKTEWQMIYRIYHKELHLPLEEIMKVQKTLNSSVYKHNADKSLPNILLA